jgi:hypothetical protein
MKTFKQLSILSALVVAAMATLSFAVITNQNFHSESLNISISGTSTLHDWTMTSDQGKLDVNFVMSNDKATGLSGLTFSIPAESLKSGKGLMDKNTYKALKTGQHKAITYQLSSAIVTPVDAVTYKIKTKGKLTIAGNARDTELDAIAKYNAADKSFTVSGSKKMKMSDYGVVPPTVMMGTIKTGNDIVIAFNTKIVQ